MIRIWTERTRVNYLSIESNTLYFCALLPIFVFYATPNGYGADRVRGEGDCFRTVTAYYVTTDKFSVSFTQSSLYQCQYRDAELIGCLEGNQFS